MSTSASGGPHRDERRLVQALAGRTAGTPRDCVTPLGNSTVSIIDNRTVIYSETRARVWRSDLPEACTGLDADDIIVLEPTAGQLCRGDPFSAVDRVSRVPSGRCRFGAFVPYDLPKR